MMDSELLIVEGKSESIRDLPSVREIRVVSESPWFISVANCPMLNTVIVEHLISSPVGIGNDVNEVTIKYREGIEDLDVPVGGNGVHTVFGDGVEKIGIVRGGHVTLGKSVREIRATQKAEGETAVECTVPEYELPTRIDFLSSEPPVIGTISPNSLSLTELRVPSGALESYARHPQWKRAAYIVDADGNTIDNYADRYRKRIEESLLELKEELKEKESAGNKAIEEAKQEKIKALSVLLHKSLGQKCLSRWELRVCEERGNGLRFIVRINELDFEIEVPLDSTHTVWDRIEDELEKIERK